MPNINRHSISRDLLLKTLTNNQTNLRRKEAETEARRISEKQAEKERALHTWKSEARATAKDMAQEIKEGLHDKFLELRERSQSEELSKHESIGFELWYHKSEKVPQERFLKAFAHPEKDEVEAFELIEEIISSTIEMAYPGFDWFYEPYVNYEQKAASIDVRCNIDLNR